MPMLFLTHPVDSVAGFREIARHYPSKRDAASSQDVWQQANELHMIRGWLLRPKGKQAQWNNPATRMWAGHADALLACHLAFADEVRARHERYLGDPENLPAEKRPSDKWPTERPGPDVSLPPWTTDARLIDRHREVLVERNPNWWRRVPGFEDVQPRGFGHSGICGPVSAATATPAAWRASRISAFAASGDSSSRRSFLRRRRVETMPFARRSSSPASAP